VEEVERLCLRRRVRAVYVTPHHQFPTTVSLKADRRSRLLDLAGRFGFAVLEDDYDHEFHYESQRCFPWRVMRPSNDLHRVNVQTAPAGASRWICGGAKRSRSVHGQRGGCRRQQGNTLTELAVAELIKSGELRRHARKALQIYRKRREAFASSLQGAFGDAIEFEAPNGGLAFWVKFRDPAVLDKIEENASSHRIKFLPSRCFAAPPYPDRACAWIWELRRARGGRRYSQTTRFSELLVRFRVYVLSFVAADRWRDFAATQTRKRRPTATPRRPIVLDVLDKIARRGLRKRVAGWTSTKSRTMTFGILLDTRGARGPLPQTRELHRDRFERTAHSAHPPVSMASGAPAFRRTPASEFSD